MPGGRGSGSMLAIVSGWRAFTGRGYAPQGMNTFLANRQLLFLLSLLVGAAVGAVVGNEFVGDNEIGCLIGGVAMGGGAAFLALKRHAKLQLHPAVIVGSSLLAGLLAAWAASREFSYRGEDEVAVAWVIGSVIGWALPGVAARLSAAATRQPTSQRSLRHEEAADTDKDATPAERLQRTVALQREREAEAFRRRQEEHREE